MARLVVVLGELAGQLRLLAQALADDARCSAGSSTWPKWVSGEALRPPAFDDPDRFLPGLDVDVRRRGGGDDQVEGGMRTAATSPTKAVPLSSCR